LIHAASGLACVSSIRRTVADASADGAAPTATVMTQSTIGESKLAYRTQFSRKKYK
jgi:hypothetical protein